jgi:hypothetical protein
VDIARTRASGAAPSGAGGGALSPTLSGLSCSFQPWRRSSLAALKDSAWMLGRADCPNWTGATHRLPSGRLG